MLFRQLVFIRLSLFYKKRLSIDNPSCSKWWSSIGTWVLIVERASLFSAIFVAGNASWVWMDNTQMATKKICCFHTPWVLSTFKKWVYVIHNKTFKLDAIQIMLSKESSTHKKFASANAKLRNEKNIKDNITNGYMYYALLHCYCFRMNHLRYCRKDIMHEVSYRILLLIKYVQLSIFHLQSFLLH